MALESGIDNWVVGFKVGKTMRPNLFIFLILLSVVSRSYGGTVATGSASVTGGIIMGVVITDGGSGYTQAPKVSLSNAWGSGAEVVAFLSGDQVGAIVVTQPGSGYGGVVTVVIEAPGGTTRLSIAAGPKITVPGSPGGVVAVEWSAALGPTALWTPLTNGVLGNVPMEVLDLPAGATTRFYRSSEVATQRKAVDIADYVWVRPGNFMMGSPQAEADRDSDEVLHRVNLTRGFWMSDHETTQEEYEDVTGMNPSYYEGASLPVENVTWTNAVEYCQQLTQRERAAGRIAANWEYRLPTEAEWEYACRAGTTGAYAGNIGNLAWTLENSGEHTREVKTKQPNAWGLYDMGGNVWEWCSDTYDNYPGGAQTDPKGPEPGDSRVLRGGSWWFESVYCRSAWRDWLEPKEFDDDVGFRVVLSVVR